MQFMLLYIKWNILQVGYILFNLKSICSKLINFFFFFLLNLGLIFSIFNQLYDDSVISQESFLLWEKSDDLTEQKWKGLYNFNSHTAIFL